MKKEFEFLNEVEMDFSKYEETSLTEMERGRMKQNLKKNGRKYHFRKNMTRIAACAAVLLAFSQTTFAKDIMEKIISIGHSSVVIMEDQNPDMDYIYPIPEELIGQVFDENGNELTEVTGETAKIYDKDGNEVMICSENEDGSAEYLDVDSVSYCLKRVDEMSKELDEDEDICSFASEAELAEALSFDLKVPKTLPEGFSLVKAYGFKDENGEVSPDYAVLVYGNGEKEFSIHERRDSEETKFETGLSDAKVIDFDGVDAVYTDSEFECSWDGVTVSILGREAVSGDEILDLAKAMK